MFVHGPPFVLPLPAGDCASHPEGVERINTNRVVITNEALSGTQDGVIGRLRGRQFGEHLGALHTTAGGGEGEIQVPSALQHGSTQEADVAHVAAEDLKGQGCRARVNGLTPGWPKPHTLTVWVLHAVLDQPLLGRHGVPNPLPAALRVARRGRPVPNGWHRGLSVDERVQETRDSLEVGARDAAEMLGHLIRQTSNQRTVGALVWMPSPWQEVLGRVGSALQTQRQTGSDAQGAPRSCRAGMEGEPWTAGAFHVVDHRGSDI